MVKSISITEKELLARYKFTNMEVAGHYLNNNKDMILCFGHYASYEWAISMHIYYHNKGYAVYKRIKNKYFDKMIRDVREKWKTELVVNKEARAKVAEVMSVKHEDAVMFAFIMDQSPSNNRNKHYAPFCNVKTPFFTGVEDIAKEYDLPLLFLGTKKIKRGYYEATYKVLAENPRDFKDYEITDMFAKALEEQIDIAPEYYFWTHKRFKFVKPLEA
ncbi:hypothetical protein ULMS_16220 [Patiriisocius marinistellae]|uniref:Lipid A biosynthesis acyltransferase n=2 Tax=Patiriisocius marinistellae TaxID=2494560 RepID=A0A5J4FY57_9FLAO|nr:hypothetical protein ULMS_16220 [Patiriisocius marinistellae]